MNTSHSPLCENPGCGACAQARATAAFLGAEQYPGEVACPSCGHRFTPGVVRVTEATATKTGVPHVNVEYADPGYRTDSRKRYPLNTEGRARSAWSSINQAAEAAQYSAGNLTKVKARVKAAMKRYDIAVSENSTTEALINGNRSFDEIRDLVRRAIAARMQSDADMSYCWAYIVDISDTDVVYTTDTDDDLWQCTYTLTGDEVTLGEPSEVARTYAPVDASDDMPATEVRQLVETVDGRVLEAKGTDAATGGRIYRVQMIAYGDSKNGRRYSESVLSAAVGMYDGAKAYDHHRSVEEIGNGTIVGLVGYYRSPVAGDRGLEADLHLLPSATHAAETLDAALALVSGEPLVGLSHDVYARFQPVTEAGRQIQDATEITAVNSVDIVSRPAAGGAVTRAVAGGHGDKTEESDVTAPALTLDGVLDVLKGATDDQLAGAGLARASETTKGTPQSQPTRTAEADAHPKASIIGRMLIKGKLDEAGLSTMLESVTNALPDRVTEADIDSQIAALKAMIGDVERLGLTPSTVTVTQEATDKKIAALDAFFAGDYSTGYRSFREAFIDFTGARPRNFDEDFNRTILRESFGTGYGPDARSTESFTSATWNLVLGDSVTRRLITEYQRPSLQTWRQVVSSIMAVNDFRTQRLDRVGGYGILPAVAQAAPYQPLTSPGNEEATYAITKRGGTEDLTLEMIANDDLRAIQRIPRKLGLSAAQTLYRFVWDTLPTNSATSYDSVALFNAGHNNIDNPAVLGQSTLSVGRRKMRQQAAYGDTKDVLSIIPTFLIVPSALEEIAFQLCTSAVAIPATPAGPTNTPNIHQGMTPLVIDYYTDTNDWYIICDPSLCPTIEIGFYQGRDTPELFTQADQTVGSMFDADKLTYKIRHIYSGTVIDHRGFYNGNN